MLADDLLRGAEAASRFLGMNRRKVYQLTECGHLPVVRLAGRLYFRKSDLERVFSPQSNKDAA